MTTASWESVPRWAIFDDTETIYGNEQLMRGTAFLCAFLVARTALASGAPMQAEQVKPARAQSQTGQLKIIAIQGTFAKHNMLTKEAVQTVVEVRNANNIPEPGVRVYFQLPETGASGFFPGQKLSQVAITNGQGQAATTGFVPNDSEGTFNLKITAMKDADTVSITVPQANARVVDQVVKKKSRKGLWILLAIAGGGGAAAAAVLGGGGGSSNGVTTPPPSVVLVPGPITVGPPR
jgi:hypothetical protein